MAATYVQVETAEWLTQTAQTDLLRFTTAGSVDDGKSTLIGRLLYDAKGVYEDQLASVRKATRNQSTNGLDLSLLTDGLRAEREQGITIDVAYRYFSTPRRKFIIADTPGHEQYTRNMATGASTANLAVILIDARHGVLPQARRHAYIAAMLGIRHIVVAVNKMDLVGYSQEVFQRICSDFRDYAARLQVPDLHFIPISALVGDNVVETSNRMPWFSGSSLLSYLETVHIASDRNLTEFRFPVQSIIRADQHFRGYAGQVVSGVIRRGEPVMVLPSGRASYVRSIVTYDGELGHAFAPMSVTICLEDEIDISRGDMLVHPSHRPHAGRKLDARLVWMSDREMELGRSYLLKHTTQTLRASVRWVRYRLNINSLEKEKASHLALNDVGAVVLETQRPLFFDAYGRNRATGSFILIDPLTNATVAGGMITGREPEAVINRARPEVFTIIGHRITRAEQESQAGHRAVTIWLDVRPELVYELERRLFDEHYRVHAIRAAEASHLPEVARALNDAGVMVLIAGGGEPHLHEAARRSAGEGSFFRIGPPPACDGIEREAEQLWQLLRQQGVLK